MIHAHRVLLAAAVLAASRRATYVYGLGDLTNEKLQVSGAGSAVVNGVYQKVESSLYTGSSTVGSLMWRQMNPAGGYTDLCILHLTSLVDPSARESWWIGHHRDATADYYKTSGDMTILEWSRARRPFVICICRERLTRPIHPSTGGFDPLDPYGIVDAGSSVWQIVQNSTCPSCFGLAPAPTVTLYLEDWEKAGPKCVQDMPFQLAKAPCAGTTGFASSCFLESVSADVAAAKYGERLAQVGWDADECDSWTAFLCDLVGGTRKSDACATDGPSCTMHKMNLHRYCWTDADCSRLSDPSQDANFCCKDEAPSFEAMADLVCDNLQLRGVELVP